MVDNRLSLLRSPNYIQSHLVTTRHIVLTVDHLSPDTNHSIFLSHQDQTCDSNVLGYRPIDSELVIGNYATYVFTVRMSES